MGSSMQDKEFGSLLITDCTSDMPTAVALVYIPTNSI
jgi:hypothetical protein